MEETKEKKETQQVKKPTYEELNDWCNQLAMQNRDLVNNLRRITNAVNKLPFLFDVLKNSEYFDAGFVAQCVEEIKVIITPPQEKVEDTDTQEEK